MTERPGRKALFTGAGAPATTAMPDDAGAHEKLAQHVRQLNDEIAAVLTAAVAGRTVSSLDPARFGAEYTGLIAAANTALPKMKQEIIQSSFAPTGTESEQVARCTETIADLEHRLELMVDSNPIPMLLTTPSFLITEANAAYVQMSGIREDKLLSTNIKDFRVTNQKGEGAKVALQEKRRSFGEITVELPSGIRVLERYCIPVIEHDSVTTLLFVYNDITGQKKQSDEIEQLRHRSETIVQQNPMPIILVDKTFHIRVVNEAYISLSGLSREDLLKKTLHDFQVLEQTGEGLKQVIQGNRRSTGEVLVKFPSGIKRLQQFGIPITDNSGNVASILIVYNDVTEERRTMEEIKELHRTSDTIVQQNPIPMLMTDARFVVTEVNAAYLTMSGLARERVMGMNLRDIKILEQKGEGAKVAVGDKRRAFGEVTVELPTGIHILEQYRRTHPRQ